jgi:phosphoribosylamine-glycine ligase
MNILLIGGGAREHTIASQQGVSLLTTTTFPAIVEALWSPSMA